MRFFGAISEYTGVKSGKNFSIPVSYFKKDGFIYCLTDGLWWNNFSVERQVDLILNKKKRVSQAKVVTNDAIFIDVLSSLIKKFPSDARYYGVQLDDDKQPRLGQLELAKKNNKMIRFTVCG